ncbi:protein translocase SecDF, variant type [Mesoplasma lactucae]|uniref:Uncharacterized protein n=1 Tax=Mesoplasma lactucae ATCC 49193 TaxID=81460 RepID=A0A291IRH6_9MOLU|nr:protein translocase SecDF, variant type [Mesoplasma lactucae]ATG97360.1 hypothetical protein CP520_01130 [Mesoplasma lactucae ATCC 49193]ATZ20188.1 bifunctional preprotein translocase subunit SecD/SecF [Mesoplasma lactucae ATCC 49193]MCL8216937.1 hypothetical protein [Mesoplasma lactucae ATCC 49193]
MDKKTNGRKIIRLLSILLLTVALVLGIVLSSVKVGKDAKYGAEYNGTYQASVLVKSDNTKQQDKLNMKEMSKSLQEKLSPFNDEQININIQGKDRLQVRASKTAYNNNPLNFRQQIESNGGMFILKDVNGIYSDIYSEDAVKKAVETNNERATSDLIFDKSVSTASLGNGQGRSPFVNMSLKTSKGANDHYVLQDVISALTQDQKQPRLTFVTDYEQLINELRYFYTLDDTREDFTQAYYDQIIVPAQKQYELFKKSDKREDQIKALVLRNLFSGTITYTITGAGTVINQTISLLDKTNQFNGGSSSINIGGLTVSGTGNYNSFKAMLSIFTPASTSSSVAVTKLGYTPAITSNFIYDSGTPNGLNDKLKFELDYAGTTGLNSLEITKQEAFNITTSFFMTQIIFADSANNIDKNTGAYGLNKDLVKLYPSLQNNFLYRNYKSPYAIIDATSQKDNKVSVPGLVSSDVAFIAEKDLGSGSSDRLKSTGFYIPTDSQTTARKAVASIQQNTLGVSYIVESVVPMTPSVSHGAYIASIVFLSIIALALALFLLFFYRLMGLYTIVIAATSAALLLLIGSLGFHIAIGPQFICALFLTIAVIVDVSMILFDSFQDNFYKKHQGAMTSFKISNKETWSIAIDALIAAFIPSVVLFWVGNGEIKNFATLATIGVFLALILGLCLGRLIYWLLMKSKWVIDNPWLLPIDTEFRSFKTAKLEYDINQCQQYLAKMDKKTKYTSKELIKIKQMTDKLAKLQAEYAKKEVELDKKTVLQDEKTVKSLNKQKSRLEQWKQKVLKFFKKENKESWIGNKFDEQIEDIDYLTQLNSEQAVDETEQKDLDINDLSISQKTNVYNKTKWVSRVGMILVPIILLIGVLAAIIGGTIGPRYSSAYGKGQVFVVYNANNSTAALSNTYDKIIEPGAMINDDNKSDDAQKLRNKLAELRKEAADSKKPLTDAEKANIVSEFYKYVIDENLYTTINGSATGIKLKSSRLDFEVIPNYIFLNPSNDPTPSAAVQITSNSTDQHSRSQFKKLLRFIANGQWNINTDEDANVDDGLKAYDLAPYSSSQQLRDIGIVLGIMLAALIIYMVIRFKWTYYVALALGLVLAVGLVFALAVIFRIPFSVEMLSGIAFLITFTLITMMLVLGKGKNTLNAEKKDKLETYFDKEIKLNADIRQKKYDYKQKLANLKKEIKKLKKELHSYEKREKRGVSIDAEAKQNTQTQLEQLQEQYKTVKKVDGEEFKQFKIKTDKQINELSRKNLYFKDLYGKLIDFSVWRMITIGVLFLATALVMTVTMPSIFSLGLIILIGIIVGSIVSLFIVVPVWVFFEKKRIRSAFGYKNFVNSLKVSQEEQIVKGIND